MGRKTVAYSWLYPRWPGPISGVASQIFVQSLGEDAQCFSAKDQRDSSLQFLHHNTFKEIESKHN